MRLLILEDETSIANFIREGLEEEGFAVDVAANRKNGFHPMISNIICPISIVIST